MKSVTDHIREHLLTNKGLVDTQLLPSIECLAVSEWSTEFEQLMRNRLIFGAYRYGVMKKEARQYDRVGSIQRRLDAYLKDGNRERLVDIANICLLEFVEQNHVRSNFNALDDDIHEEDKA
jgi:hypothetical protein